MRPKMGAPKRNLGPQRQQGSGGRKNQAGIFRVMQAKLTIFLGPHRPSEPVPQVFPRRGGTRTR
jgi:hypothetical protein